MPSTQTYLADFPCVRRMDPNTYCSLSTKTTYTWKLFLTDPTLTSALHNYSATHTFFRKLGHQLKVQILDNETSESLFTYFDSQHIAYQPVPPNQKRANAAERSIQTFRRHFLSLLATTHPSRPINHWPALLPQAELTLNLLRPAPTFQLSLPTTASIAHPTTFSHTRSHHAAPSSYSTTLVRKLGTTLDLSASISDQHSNTIALTTVLFLTPTPTGCVITSSYIRHL
jgi:hypothetical protein